MADDRDILGKADALLRRHVPPRAAAEPGDVPVLTELITPGAASASPHPPGAGSLPADTSESRDAFTRDLVAEVVSAVQGRLAQDLERRLTQQVVGELQAAVAAALGDLRQDIANAVGDAVAEALARRPHR